MQTNRNEIKKPEAKVKDINFKMTPKTKCYSEWVYLIQQTEKKQWQ